MEKDDDPYEILGVGYDASESDIKKAYRKAAIKYHPDKQTNDEDRERAHDIFAKLSAAYDTLSDPVKRYDWKQANESKLKRSNSTGSSASTATTASTSSNYSAARRTTPVSTQQTQRPAPGRVQPRPAPQKQQPQQQQRPNSYRQPPTQQAPPQPRQRASMPPQTRSPQMPQKHAPQNPVRAPQRQNAPAPQQRGGYRPADREPQSYPKVAPQNRREAPGAPQRPPPQFTRHNSAPPPNARAPPNRGPEPRAPTRRVSTGPPPGARGPANNRGGPPPPPRRQSTGPTVGSGRRAGVTTTSYKDPFELFDSVMKEEYGDDYKNTSDFWKEAKGVKGLAKLPNPFGKGSRKENSRKEFKKLDVNKDKSLTKDELSKYIESHSDLWTMLGVQLNLNVTRCISIATQVAFQLATQQDSIKDTRGKEMTEKEFTHFHKNYVLDPKGAHEFFLRTIFTAFDLNGDGVLQRNELDRFLDLFYEATVFQQKNNPNRRATQLPSKEALKRIVLVRLDKNRDGVLTFDEMRELLEVAAVVTNDNSKSNSTK